MAKPKLIHLFNNFRSGAITHIVRDLQPMMGQHYDVNIVALQRISDDAYLVEQFRDLGINVHTLDCHRLNVLSAAAKLHRFLRKIHPSIIHAHAGRSAILAPICSPRNVPVYVTYHSVAEGYCLATRCVLRLMSQQFTARTGVSKAVSNSWQRLGVKSIETIHNPVNLGAVHCQLSEGMVKSVRHEFKIPDEVPLLLNVGRLIYAKGQDILIDSAHRLYYSLKQDFRLIIAGRGPEEERLKKKVQQLKLEEKVLFAGFRNDVPTLLAAADIFVFPSRWEGLPVAALEAMASGTAVVSSDIESIHECIANGKTGIIILSNEYKDLANSLHSLIKKPDLRYQISNAGQLFAKAKFEPKRIAEQYINLYTQ